MAEPVSKSFLNLLFRWCLPEHQVYSVRYENTVNYTMWQILHASFLAQKRIWWPSNFRSTQIYVDFWKDKQYRFQRNLDWPSLGIISFFSFCGGWDQTNKLVTAVARNDFRLMAYCLYCVMKLSDYVEYNARCLYAHNHSTFSADTE